MYLSGYIFVIKPKKKKDSWMSAPSVTRAQFTVAVVAAAAAQSGFKIPRRPKSRYESCDIPQPR